jgi:hypothetical protein
MNARSGRLYIVGTGITAGQMTIESQNAAVSADILLYVAADKVTTHYLEELNPNAESLQDSYEDGGDRFSAYARMVSRITAPVRSGLIVCAAFYGHPGVFAFPSHEAIRVLRAEGYEAKMLPGVSAEDCLFADIGLDPSMCGCQSFEATDFLIHNRTFDVTSSLVLWQVGVVGDLTFKSDGYGSPALGVLAERLAQFYGELHRIILYEAAQVAITEPRIELLRIEDLLNVTVSPITTMYVPPLRPAVPDRLMLDRLGLSRSDLPEVEVRLATASHRL